ncbi:MAG: hypothetical protein QM753_19900 [Thermomicrobiales bacterium]
MIHPTRPDSTSARDYATDCLAWRIDVPTAASFLTGSTLADAVNASAHAYGVEFSHADNVATLAGLGMTARIDGTFVAAGTTALFASLDIRLSPAVMQTVAQIRLRGNDAILIGGWKGVRHVAEIVNPAQAKVIASHAA